MVGNARPRLYKKPNPVLEYKIPEVYCVRSGADTKHIKPEALCVRPWTDIISYVD
jgi:hypothetical protein